MAAARPRRDCRDQRVHDQLGGRVRNGIPHRGIERRNVLDTGLQHDCRRRRHGDLTAPAGTSGRYVRLTGTARTTIGGAQYGYSIYELQVLGTSRRQRSRPRLTWRACSKGHRSTSRSPEQVVAEPGDGRLRDDRRQCRLRDRLHRRCGNAHVRARGDVAVDSPDGAAERNASADQDVSRHARQPDAVRCRHRAPRARRP